MGKASWVCGVDDLLGKLTGEKQSKGKFKRDVEVGNKQIWV